MTTEKLYWQDSLCREFCAQVTDYIPTEAGGRAELSRTAFFPEGGGQKADTGCIGTARVTDVQEKDGRIWHTVDAPLTVGQSYPCAIDWARRLDLMQQHSGEHIVSGLIHSRYGYDNVGFHLGSEVVTIDFDGELTAGQLREIEQAANAYITQDVAVEVWEPSREQLSKIDYRSKKQIDGQVRLVVYPGVDICACCAVHVPRTGYIGQIRLLSVVKFRKGCRIEMIAGGRADAYLHKLAAANKQIMGLLSAKPLETAEAVARLLGERDALRAQVAALQEEIFAYRAKDYAGAAKAVIHMPRLDANGVRKLCVALMAKTNGLCAVFSGDDERGYKYALGQQGADLRAQVAALNKALNGRGGGKDAWFAQGSLKATAAQIEAYMEQV